MKIVYRWLRTSLSSSRQTRLLWRRRVPPHSFSDNTISHPRISFNFFVYVARSCSLFTEYRSRVFELSILYLERSCTIRYRIAEFCGESPAKNLFELTIPIQPTFAPSRRY